MKNVLCALVLSLFAAAVNAQSSPIPVGLEAISGTPQTVWVNAVLPEPFVARVVRTDTGAPVAGVRVGMENNFILCMPLHPTCVPPPRSMYGQFESGLSVSLLSDAQGLVTAPAYRAGTTEGRYSVYAWVSSNNQLPGINIDPQLGQSMTRFEIEQRGTGTANAVPSLSTWAILLLAGLSMLAAFLRMRREA